MASKETLEVGANLEEREKRSSFGLALVIVGIDPSRNGENITEPKFWTIRERKTKPGTEREEGQISFPAETKKHEEGLIDNMFGALSEFTDDNDKVMNNLFFIAGSSYVEGKISVKGNPADLIILIHEGPLDKPTKPVDQDEVVPNGWMTIKELKREYPESVRAFSRDVLSLEESEGLITKVVAEYFRSPMKRLPLRSMLPKNFSSMTEFYRQREKLPDFLVVPKS